MLAINDGQWRCDHDMFRIAYWRLEAWGLRKRVRGDSLRWYSFCPKPTHRWRDEVSVFEVEAVGAGEKQISKYTAR